MPFLMGVFGDLKGVCEFVERRREGISEILERRGFWIHPRRRRGGSAATAGAHHPAAAATILPGSRGRSPSRRAARIFPPVRNFGNFEKGRGALQRQPSPRVSGSSKETGDHSGRIIAWDGEFWESSVHFFVILFPLFLHAGVAWVAAAVARRDDEGVAPP